MERTPEQIEDDKAARKIIVDQVYESLNHFKTHFKDYCKRSMTETVPLKYIEKSIEIYIDAFQKGLGK